MGDHNTDLLSTAPPTTTDAWRTKIAKDLKLDGPDDPAYQKKLFKNHPAGFQLAPFYRSEDLAQLAHAVDGQPGHYPYVRGNRPAGSSWSIRQDVDHPQPDKANALLLGALENGAEAIGLCIANMSSSRPGTIIGSKDHLDALLQGIHLEMIETYILAGERSPEILAALLESDAGKKVEQSGGLRGAIGFDPLATALRTGKLGDDAWSFGASMVTELEAKHPHLKALTIDSGVYHGAGADGATELALTLAAASEALFHLVQAGCSPNQVARAFSFNFHIGPDYFSELCKLRAARLLWSQIAAAYGVKPEYSAAHIQAVTADFSYTVYDPYVNMLRGTTEAMSAALGGADVISVQAFDYRLDAGGEFSQRIARNTQHLLKHESYVDRVADPAGGSYYLENLTGQIAAAAWTKFQEVEKGGGLIEGITTGQIQKELTAAKDQRLKRIANRRDTLLGTNQYPNVKDELHIKTKGKLTTQSEQQRRSPVGGTEHRDFNEVRKASVNGPVDAAHFFLSGKDIDAVDSFFLGGQFEHLRQAVENHGAKKRPPKVLLVGAGNLAMRNARSIFLLNFFQSAGFNVEPFKAYDTADNPDAFLKDVAAQKPDIVGYCSSDDEYAQWLKVYHPALQAAHPDIVPVVAGNPGGEDRTQIEKLGIEKFIHMRSEFLAELTSFCHLVGIEL